MTEHTERRQVVRFAFYRLDPAWRRLSAERQASSKIEFGETIAGFAGQLLLRPYGLVGIRGDCDFLLWQVAETLDALVALQTALNRTDLGAYLTLPYSYLAMTRRSIYEFPEDPNQPSRLVIRPSDARYLFVYPFIKTRAWYMLPKAERQTMMDEHVRVGRKYPSIRLNTTYSYGLDDQEFIVAFEGGAGGLAPAGARGRLHAGRHTRRPAARLEQACVCGRGGGRALQRERHDLRDLEPLHARPGLAERRGGGRGAVRGHLPLARGRVLARVGPGPRWSALVAGRDLPGEARGGHRPHRSRRGARSVGCRLTAAF